jgi:outer membrane protein assembly factor BamB
MLGRTQRRTFVLLCIVALACALAADAADWPRWRGPDGDGVSRETGLLKAWPPEGPAVAWKAEGLGEGYSGVAVVGGRVYTQANINGVEGTVALNEADGAFVWGVETHEGPGYTNGQGNGPRGTPTVADGRLYVEGAWGDVVCHDAATGNVLWRTNLINDLGGGLPGWGYSESPLLYGDMLIVTPGGGQGAVAALNKDTGAVIWRTAEVPDAAEYSSPVAAEIGGIAQIVQFVGGGVFGMTPDAGAKLWSYRHQKAQNSINITTPVVAQDHVLISSAYGNGTGAARITTADGRQTAQEAYFLPGFPNHHGGIIKLGDYVYGTNDRGLLCVEFLTGRTVWEDRSVGKGSLTIADGMIYVLGEMRQLALAEATPDGYREHGRIRIDDRGRPTWSHPVVANGRLYIRNQDVLTAYDVATH